MWEPHIYVGAPHLFESPTQPHMNVGAPQSPRMEDNSRLEECGNPTEPHIHVGAPHSPIWMWEPHRAPQECGGPKSKTATRCNTPLLKKSTASTHCCNTLQHTPSENKYRPLNIPPKSYSFKVIFFLNHILSKSYIFFLSYIVSKSYSFWVIFIRPNKLGCEDPVFFQRKNTGLWIILLSHIPFQFIFLFNLYSFSIHIPFKSHSLHKKKWAVKALYSFCHTLQCIASTYSLKASVCCRMLPCVAVWCRVLPCVAAVCCSVLRCVAVCCSVLQCVAVCYSVLQCVAVCCRVLPCVAVCCSVLQCLAVCCSVLRCDAHCSICLHYCNICVHQKKEPYIPSKRALYSFKKSPIFLQKEPYILPNTPYGVATITRLLNIIGLFCRISSLL